MVARCPSLPAFRRWRWMQPVTGSLLLLLAGCQELALPPEESAPPPTAASADSTPAAPETAGTSDPANTLPPGVPPTAGPQPTQPPRVEATAGVGARGRGYGGGVITEPLRQRFLIEQRLVFQIQIPQAMNLYKATNERGPQSHDEFMQQIIQANGIQLPELPPGERYVFDPVTQQLMVERPLRPNEVPPGNPATGTLPPSTAFPGGGSGP